MRLLCSESFEVYLKTSAAGSLPSVDRRVPIVLGLKPNCLIRRIFWEDQIKSVMSGHMSIKARMLEGNLN